MLDEIRQVVVFSKIAELGSFRQAANELKISPSVVSHHISQLEGKLGQALIHRSTRRLSLTTSGLSLFEANKVLLDTVEGEISALKCLVHSPFGLLRVSFPTIASQSPLTF